MSLSQVLEKLWELQSVMSNLAVKEKSLNSKPEDFLTVEIDFLRASQEMEQLEQKIAVRSKERREIESELQDAQEALKKFQGQLMQVKNQIQYAAAWKEIDTARKKIKELEDNLLKLMGEIEEGEKDLGVRKEAHTELKSLYDSEYERWQGGLGNLKSEITQIRNQAGAIEQHIPEQFRNAFHQIFKKRQDAAVSRVVNNSCSLCRVVIRAQALQQLRRGEIITCEGCRRFLYFERAVS